MSYTKIFDKDVFISYAHIDNQPLQPDEGRGWVSSFQNILEVRLAQLLGLGPQIWKDEPLMGNDIFSDTIGDRLLRTATMVCIISYRYLHSEWCMRELHEFLNLTTGRAVGQSPRVFLVTKSPVSDSDLPELIQNLPKHKFFELDPDSGRHYELEPIARDLGYWAGIDSLAHHLAKTLADLRPSGVSGVNENEAITTEMSPSPKPTVHDPYRIIASPTITRPLRVFLCHSSGDKEAVRALYRRISLENIEPWLDEENILPGQRWEDEISIAVRDTDVVLICLSESAIGNRGYIHKEIRFALDVADEQPEGAIFLIPVKLEKCEVPRRLANWQWVDLYRRDGHGRLFAALRARATQISITGNPT